MKIGIIGMGVVGRAVNQGCPNHVWSTLDKYRTDRSTNSDRMIECELVFVCVPTPTTPKGQDISEVTDALSRLAHNNFKGVVVLKSTVLPGTTRGLSERFPRLRIVHNPEFLSEKTASEDFRAQKAALISGRMPDLLEVDTFYASIMRVPQSIMAGEYEVTEWAKYIHNCSLAVFLSFLNEVYGMVGNQSTFNRAVKYASMFGNLPDNNSVPGPDGKRGWGGMCFPKDMVALMRFSEQFKEAALTITGAVMTNEQLRPAEMSKFLD